MKKLIFIKWINPLKIFSVLCCIFCMLDLLPEYLPMSSPGDCPIVRHTPALPLLHSVIVGHTESEDM